jgi:alkane 1-monooxygenase
MLSLYVVDNMSPPDHRQPPEDLSNWPYNLQIYALFTIQVTNYAMVVVTASKLHVNDAAGIAQAAAMIVPTVILGGINAGYSGIVISHEFIHRRSVIEYTMGRILLCGVLYEHFATEHVRGHHPRIGTLEDPATARFGETHWEFVKRTVPAQFRSAWQLEKVRLGAPDMPWYDARMVRHRVLQGVVVEASLLVAITVFFGPLALGFFLLQAFTASFLLETVNYIEHWGLERTGKKVVSVDSWDTDNWFTLYTLVGLSRHADHHAQASRPYHKLRHFHETAKMPAGYYGTIMKAMLNNQSYRELATAELMKKGLGPFRTEHHTAPLTHLHPSVHELLEKTDAVA